MNRAVVLALALAASPAGAKDFAPRTDLELVAHSAFPLATGGVVYLTSGAKRTPATRP